MMSKESKQAGGSAGRRTARGLLVVTGLLAGLLAGEVQGGWTVLVHNSESLSAGTAKCLAAPKKSLNRLLIQRIRITRGGSTAVDHTFVAKVTDDVAGLNYSVSGCAAPGCRSVLAVQGGKEGEVYDMDGLDILLPPGARLYYYPSATPGSNVTIEVFYKESQ